MKEFMKILRIKPSEEAEEVEIKNDDSLNEWKQDENDRSRPAQWKNFSS